MRFPAAHISLSRDALAAEAVAVRPQIEAYLAAHGVAPASFVDSLEAGFVPLAAWLAQRRLRPGETGPLIVGVSGAQGTGKSTLAGLLSLLLSSQRLRCATLSLDDLYLTRAERTARARSIHPLLQTRGVPGTHDVALGQRLFAALAQRAPSRVALPRFDKAADDRAAEDQWSEVETPIDCLIFEGWCVGARAVAEAELEAPLNALERDEDRDGSFRRYANAMLAGPYRALFDAVDALVFLAAPDLESSQRWRIEQEHKLRARTSKAARTLSDAELGRFVQYYERISRQMLADLPARADVVLPLTRSHEFDEPYVHPREPSRHD